MFISDPVLQNSGCDFLGCFQPQRTQAESCHFSPPRKGNLQADQEVAVQFEEQMSGNSFSHRAETSLAAQYPDPVHIPKH